MALKKYGVVNFIAEEVMSCFDRQSLNEMEIHFIKELDTVTPKGYNLTFGGESTTFTAEARARMSVAQKKKCQDPEYMERCLARTSTSKYRKNMSRSQKNVSPEEKARRAQMIREFARSEKNCIAKSKLFTELWKNERYRLKTFAAQRKGLRRLYKPVIGTNITDGTEFSFE
jgi:hypothetical protein